MYCFYLRIKFQFFFQNPRLQTRAIDKHRQSRIASHPRELERSLRSIALFSISKREFLTAHCSADHAVADGSNLSQSDAERGNRGAPSPSTSCVNSVAAICAASSRRMRTHSSIQFGSVVTHGLRPTRSIMCDEALYVLRSSQRRSWPA
jgi:hypothetical protein